MDGRVDQERLTNLSLTVKHLSSVMDEVKVKTHGGKRAGAGRPRNATVDEYVKLGGSRATLYRHMQGWKLLVDEEKEFGADRLWITHEARKIAAKFDDEAIQRGILACAIKYRREKEHSRPSNFTKWCVEKQAFSFAICPI